MKTTEIIVRAFAHKYFLVFCATVLTLGVIAMLTDREQSNPPMIDPSDLAKIQVGDVARLSDLLKDPASKVCFLTPISTDWRRLNLLANR